ncbi:hypothetical protein GCM10011390_41590 [Aureimonas endophytica]|uniref:Uncharacterized protein n=1 Tax=Aureimonas endophytica TaxID=2027858 RepID=A0A917EBX5_9HYPH|nr:hypothetical protein GCM10011390_41590 [Aureimonas endophytica]
MRTAGHRTEDDLPERDANPDRDTLDRPAGKKDGSSSDSLTETARLLIWPGHQTVDHRPPAFDGVKS